MMTLEKLTEVVATLREGMRKDVAGAVTLQIESDGPSSHVARAGDAWTIFLTPGVMTALSDPEADDFAPAALALAHAVQHTMGSGPGFVRPEEQFLEEAIAELLALEHLPELVDALGVDVNLYDRNPVVAGGEYDLVITRPLAAAASCERLARLLVWLSDLEENDDEDGWWLAVVGLARKLQPLAGAARFSLLATAGAAKADPADDAEEDTAETLEEYLRGYLRQLQPSDTGFAALDAALDFAAFGEKAAGARGAAPAREDWQRELATLEGVVMEPMPGRERLEAALEQAAEADDEIAAAVDRSLDCRLHLWAKRNEDAATRSAAGGK